MGHKRVLFGILLFAAFAPAPARADLTLLSQDFYQGIGSKFQGVITPTAFTHGPFPQTPTNSITFDQEGMHVLGNVLGHDNATSSVFGVNQNWLVSGYTVTFQIDAPEPYTFTSDPNNAAAFYVGSLTGPGTGIVLNGLAVRSSSGTLRPGTYTFHMDTASEGPMPTLLPGENYISNIVNARLTVLPEPATISILAAGALTLLRCRDRRQAPSVP